MLIDLAVGTAMTRPKKWFLERGEEPDGVIVKTSEGPLRKANASKPLGRILSVAVPTEEQCGKYPIDESVLVSLHGSSVIWGCSKTRECRGGIKCRTYCRFRYP